MNGQFCFVFDMDGTITSCETLPLIGKHFGIDKEIEKLTQNAIAGNVPYLENFIYRIHMLANYPVKEISTLLKNVPLHEPIINFIARHSDQCRIATTNLDVWIEQLQTRLPCPVHCSHASLKNDSINRLETVLKKDQLVTDLQAQGFKVAFIGDGNNDMEAMRLADVAIASGLTHPPAKSILLVADYICYDENALCRFLEHLC